MNLPNDVEFIFIDDGSNPPLTGEMKNLTFYRTNNQLAWTQGIGRNLGASKAKGEYLLMTDIDHILSKEAIGDVRNFNGDRMMFHRFFGVLTEEGELTQDLEILRDYGLDVDNLKQKRGLYASVHLNTFAIKKSTFELLGGYEPRHSLVGYHPTTKSGDDCYFNGKWNRYALKNNLKLDFGSDIYMFPVGRFHINGETNPKGLFHNLSYEPVKSYKSAN